MEPKSTAGKAHLSEKRAKTRIKCDYLATVRGLDARGNESIQNARVINLSTGGIFIVAQQPIQNNSEVHVNIALGTGSHALGTSRLATRGNVIRNELQADGAVGLAIQFQGYAFL